VANFWSGNTELYSVQTINAVNRAKKYDIIRCVCAG
jgi:hypothetical protein